MSLSQITCRLNVACDISMRMRPSAAEVWAPGGHELRDGASPSAWADVRYPPTGAVTRRGRVTPPAHPAIRAPLPSSSPGTSSYRPRSLGLLAAPALGHGPRVPGDRWPPEEHVEAVWWIISRWCLRRAACGGRCGAGVAGSRGEGLGGGQVKRSRTCVVGAAGSGLCA